MSSRAVLPLTHSLRRNPETRLWEALLRRPGQRSLLWEGRTRHGAVEAMLNGLCRLAVRTPERVTVVQSQADA